MRSSIFGCNTLPSDRRRGIALLVVMVVFVVLYLVVYQLHFSTKMEERLAEKRAGDVEAFVAVQSAAGFVLTHLVEDLKSDASGSASGGPSAAPGATTKEGGGSRTGEVAKADMGEGMGTFADLSGAAGGGSAQGHDALHERLFQDNRQQVGNISVKISIRDGERYFDVNRLFDYVRLKDEEVEGGAANLSEEELASAVEGKDGKDAALSLREKMLQKSKSLTKKKKEAAGAAAGSKDGTAGEAGDATAGPSADTDLAAQSMSDYELDEFIPPEPERVEATRLLLARAIESMLSINEFDYGYVYHDRKYNASAMASRIVDYVLERRSSPYNNRIYLVSELLNLNSGTGNDPADITPEVFYGPYPRLTSGEEEWRGDGFLLKRDEFGDIVPEYQHGDLDQAFLDEENRQIENLQQQFGQFVDLGAFGFDSLKANPMTRGMQELPIAVDENGLEYVVDTPYAIGLKDLFTTFSTGKINLNTAPVPVIFALLQSCSEEEALFVAASLRDYRLRFQEETEEEGVAKVAAGKEQPDLGQPKRAKKDEEKEKQKKDASAAGSAALGGASSLLGVDPSLIESIGSSYQDPELNYFTKIEQIELIDGTDEGPTDRLRSDEGVQKVSAEDDTLYRRVLHDLEKVKTFRSTYFTAELKAKPREGGALRTGCLTARRDPQRRIVDVVLWKNLQK